MPNLLNLDTVDWCLKVWTSSIDSAKEELKTTLRSRGAKFPKQEIRLKTSRLLNPSSFIEVLGDSAFLQEAIFLKIEAMNLNFYFQVLYVIRISLTA